MTADEHTARLARIRADRAAVGRSPVIESPAVYRLLAAVLDATEKRPEQN